eukprot:5863249-Karenia_brevis.AAC.1
MTTLLQTLATLANNKGVGRDGVPVEALKALDWQSYMIVLECFEKRLNAIIDFDQRVQAWMDLLA